VNELYFNLIALASSTSLVLTYYVYLRARLRNNPSYTIQAVNAKARAAWVERIMTGDGGREILAVQTLRNSTMAATFLASTAILLIMGVLNLMPKSSGASTLLHSLQLQTVGGDLATLKLLSLLVAFFWAFFCFSLAVRLYNHVGYLINAGGTGQSYHSPEFVARLLNRSGRYYSLGMRAYYLSVPLVFWLFGPWYLIGAAIGLVAVLYSVDRAPETIGPEQPQANSTPSPAHLFRLISGRA
jgi:uncharacterized membrane protein